jgi:hypothetical protein
VQLGAFLWVEESGVALETFAASSGIPLDELRDEILDGGDGPLTIEDATAG